MKEKAKKLKVSPIISIIGERFVSNVDSSGSPKFRKTRKDYIGIGENK